MYIIIPYIVNNLIIFINLGLPLNLNPMKTSNLKKLSRSEQRSINGGALKKCVNNNQCFGGYCCDRFCVPDACMEA